MTKEWTTEAFHRDIIEGIPEDIPEPPPEDPNIPRAPARRNILSTAEERQALTNALRYFPKEQHPVLAPEFARELRTRGRIYMYRYRPHYPMYARPIDEYPAKTAQAAAIMLMIQNNLDPAVAKFPYELITYGGNGTVFPNWAQYRLTMKYLAELRDDQTLVLYSGHPLGVFPSSPEAPRVILTNGMVIPNHSGLDDYDRMSALGVTSYGQMTAGSFMYIGPQGIVHGTTITILNAGRLYLGTESGLEGHLYVSSGLGGMSGAQAKAAVIAGAASIIAEINPSAARKRKEQGWLMELTDSVEEAVSMALEAKKAKKPISVGYLGNVVDLWEYLVDKEIEVELGSDQTSLHIPFSGGYYPAGLSYEESNRMMVEDPDRFRELVQESLRRHVKAVNTLADRGMHFWDYGNAFLLEASRAGADVMRGDGSFRYPSYVEDIMGPLCFDFGFGPFRWVVTSGRPEELALTDALAARVLEEQAARAPVEIRQQIRDNLRWIREAGHNRLVVGSQARILYADAWGRIAIAREFNRAIREGRISSPIVLGRDHHDVSGTDSPYRETSNIRDGSMFTADMAVHNFVGDAVRGATWVSLHNGGGVGWGEVINGGFGLVLDGSTRADRALDSMLFWDVNNGISRRAWARNPNAIFTARRVLAENPGLAITLPTDEPDPELLTDALDQASKK